MKSIHLVLILSTLILTACPGVQYEDAMKKLYKNHMDLPNPIKAYHGKIHFTISDLFQDNYNTDFVLKDNALTRTIYDLNLNFTVEEFSKSEAEAYKFDYTENTTLLNAVHDHYARKRQESLTEHFSSIKKSVPKSVGFNGVIQTIEGDGTYSTNKLIYLMSTVEIGGNYYVFQLIGKKENMGYLYDDFISILNSIEK